MTMERRAFLVSVCLHLLVIGSAVVIVALPAKPQEPILVDLTIEQGPPSDTVAQGGDPGAAASPAPFADHPSVLEPVASVAELLEKQAVESPRILSVAAEAVPVSGTVASPVASSVVAAVSGGGSPASVTSVPGTGGSVSGIGSGADIAGAGAGSRGESAEALRARYLRKNFAYIRDLINGNLRYPGKARRMGWSGALKVEFVVREDGSAAAIRVAKSSGISLLDSDAEETVRRSAPFPRPPVSARLIIPVEYVLE